MVEENGWISSEPLLLQRAQEEEAEEQIKDERERAPLDWRGRPAPSSLGSWKAASFMLASSCLQAVAISGCTVNLVIFMVRVMQLDNASAANTITTWIGTTFLTSIVGGSLGDAYMGRLWTSVLYMGVYVAGLVLFAVSGTTLAERASLSCTSETDCHAGTPSVLHTALFYVALYTMGLGTASLAPNVVSLGADQFNLPKQKSAFIGLHMTSSSLGTLVVTCTISYVENEGHWKWGFWISAAVGISGFLVFLVGIPSMRQFNPGINPLLQIMRVIFAAMSNQKVTSTPLPLSADVNTSETIARNGLRRIPSMRWLEKAAIASPEQPTGNNHKSSHSICTEEHVEEVKSIFRLLPFWLCGILVASVMSQKGTMFVLQADTMDNRLWGKIEFPPSSMILFSLAMVIMGTPLNALVIEPWIMSCRGSKHRVPSIERMGAGLVVAIAGLFVAAIVEGQRLKLVSKQEDASFAGKGQVPMSIFWLVPQYVLEGLTTVLFSFGHLEFNYVFSPESMRSLSTAISMSGFALGNYLSTVMVELITSFTPWIPNDLNQGHLDYYYWFLDGLLLFTGILFLASSKWVLSTQALPPEEGGLLPNDEESLTTKSTLLKKKERTMYSR